MKFYDKRGRQSSSDEAELIVLSDGEALPAYRDGIYFKEELLFMQDSDDVEVVNEES